MEWVQGGAGVILFLPRTESLATPATALRVSLKSMNGSHVKAISRFRSAFSPEAVVIDFNSATKLSSKSPRA
jgi:hypothetical protein